MTNDLNRLLEFFRRTIPTSGGSYWIGSQKPQKRFHAESCSDLMTLAAKCVTRGSENRDVWYGVSTFGPGGRKVSDVREKRSLYIDIDCGPNKSYPKIKDAIKALRDRLKENSIPMPTIVVVSGNGIHAYWTLNRNISLAEWAPLASGLHETLETIGVKTDPVVTKDAARILRVPGTLNWKQLDNPRQCYVLDQVTQEHDYDPDHLATSFGLLQTPDPVLPNQDATVDNDDLVAGTVVHQPRSAKRMFAKGQCGMFRNLLQTKGANVAEPLWQNQLLALAFTSNGDQLIHKISSGHKKYSKSVTEKKFAEKQAQMPGLAGPPQCDTFERLGATECATCRHKDRIKNPLLLLKEPLIELPEGYTQTEKGVWRIPPPDSDESATLVLPYPITAVQLVEPVNQELPGELRLTLQFSKEYLDRIDIPTNLITKNGLRSFLSANIIGIQDWQERPLANFMSSWMVQLRAARQTVKPITQFGWTKEAGKNGFAVGTTVFWEDDSRVHAPVRVDPQIGEVYTPKGNYGPWEQAASRIIRMGRPEYQVALASAFAAPLMPLTGLSGCLLSLMSPKSGTGKSTALKVAQAVWGNPKRGVNALNDTTNAVAHKLGIVNNLPAYWDELRVHADVKNFLKLIFSVSQGKEKSRMRGATGHADMGSWATLITSASNESVLGHVDDAINGSDAGRYRVMEIVLDQQGAADDVADKLFSGVEENYGHAGTAYAEWLARHRGRAQKTVDFYSKRFLEGNNMQRDERFWRALMVTVMAGAAIANKLGLTAFDLDKMEKYLNEELRRHRANLGVATGNTSALEVMKNFLHTKGNQIINCDHFRQRGRSGGTKDPTLLGQVAPLQPYVAQYADVDKRLAVVVNQFKEWVSNNQRDNWVRIKDELISKGAEERKLVLGSGVVGLGAVMNNRQPVLLFDLENANFSELYDDSGDDPDFLDD